MIEFEVGDKINITFEAVVVEREGGETDDCDGKRTWDRMSVYVVPAYRAIEIYWSSDYPYKEELKTMKIKSIKKTGAK